MTLKPITCILLVVIATSAIAGSEDVDERMAARAEVVLRVRYVSSDVCDKYCWYRVQVLRVIKNKTDEAFKRPFDVAAYSWKTGVPEGESTLYLERYSEASKGLWKLVGGEAASGVSHAKKP